MRREYDKVKEWEKIHTEKKDTHGKKILKVNCMLAQVKEKSKHAEDLSVLKSAPFLLHYYW